MVKIIHWIGNNLAAVVAACAFISSLLNRNRLQGLHRDVNSRLTELLNLTHASGKALGVIEGKEQSARDRLNEAENGDV